MTDDEKPAKGEKLAWNTPRLELLGTMDDVRSGGVVGLPDLDFEPGSPPS